MTTRLSSFPVNGTLGISPSLCAIPFLLSVQCCARELSCEIVHGRQVRKILAIRRSRTSLYEGCERGAHDLPTTHHGAQPAASLALACVPVGLLLSQVATACRSCQIHLAARVSHATQLLVPPACHMCRSIVKAFLVQIPMTKRSKAKRYTLRSWMLCRRMARHRHERGRGRGGHRREGRFRSLPQEPR